MNDTAAQGGITNIGKARSSFSPSAGLLPPTATCAYCKLGAFSRSAPVVHRNADIKLVLLSTCRWINRYFTPGELVLLEDVE